MFFDIWIFFYLSSFSEILQMEYRPHYLQLPPNDGHFISSPRSIGNYTFPVTNNLCLPSIYLCASLEQQTYTAVMVSLLLSS
jgi:hypothetical protein